MTRARSGRRSGLLVPVPATEPLVGEYRARWDPPAAHGVPAHVTVLYPFVAPSRLDVEIEEGIADALAGIAAFDVEFPRCGRFGDDVLYLAPNPWHEFLTMTETLVRRFPEHVPYGGKFDAVIPHLTVADTAGAPLDALEHEITASLPISTRAHEVWLMEEGVDSWWRTRRVYPLVET